MELRERGANNRQERLLYTAVNENDIDEVRRLIEPFGNDGAFAFGIGPPIALRFAFQRGSISLSELLLCHGLDVAFKIVGLT